MPRTKDNLDRAADAITAAIERLAESSPLADELMAMAELGMALCDIERLREKIRRSKWIKPGEN